MLTSALTRDRGDISRKVRNCSAASILSHEGGHDPVHYWVPQFPSPSCAGKAEAARPSAAGPAVAAAPPVGGSGAQWRPPARRDHGDADDDDTDDDEATTTTTTTLTMNLPAWQIMVIQTMRQILRHFEAHDDGDGDDITDGADYYRWC